MKNVRPVLFLVSGPQKSQQFPLLDNVIIAGRASTATIRLTEEYVSREQLRFEFTADGWVVENLSATASMWVNDRKFRPGKQILLAGGDCILVGYQTRLLFIEPGDNTDEAADIYYRKHPDVAAQKHTAEKPAPASSRVVVAAPVSEKKKTPKDKSPRQKQKQLTPAEVEERSRKKKIRKYVIGGGVYLLFMILLVVVLLMVKKDGGSAESNARPPLLTRGQILTAISSNLSGSPNDIAAQWACDKARDFYDNRSADEQNLYLCVKNYRLFQALRPKTRRAFKPQDEINFNNAKAALTIKIMKAYDNAIILENRRKWKEAIDAFDYVLRIVPPNSEDPEVEKVIVGNVRRHIKYVGNMLKKKRK